MRVGSSFEPHRLALPLRWMVGALATAMLIAAGFIIAELLLNLPLRHL